MASDKYYSFAEKGLLGSPFNFSDISELFVIFLAER